MAARAEYLSKDAPDEGAATKGLLFWLGGNLARDLRPGFNPCLLFVVNSLPLLRHKLDHPFPPFSKEAHASPRIALEVDALYFQKGSKIKIIYGNVVGDPFLERMDELSFPILFKYYFKQGSSPYVLGGGELAIVLAKDPKNIDIGLVFGAGFRKQVRSTYISLEGRYHHGLKDTTTGSWALRKMRVFALIVGLSI